MLETGHTDYDHLPADEIKEIQYRNLSWQLEHAYNNSPFYNRLYKKLDIYPSDLKSIDDIAALPLISREDLSENNFEFLAVPRDKVADVSRTSGTTGNSIYVYMSHKDLWHACGLCARQYISLGIEGWGAGLALLLPADELINPSLAQEIAFRDMMGLPFYRIGPISRDKQLKYLQDLAPGSVDATPSSLLTLGEFIKSKGIDPRSLNILRAHLLGQPLYGAGWKPLVLKTKLEELWGCEVISAYGTTELFSGNIECSAHAGHHIPHESVLVEIIDPDTGEPLPPGVPGEVVITTLYREAMPLIRYRTKDISWLEVEPCACGATTPRVMAVLGRKDDFLKIKGTGMFPGDIENSIMKVDGITGYLIKAYIDESGQELVEIIIASGLEPEAIVGRVKAQVKADTMVTPKVTVDSQEAVNAQVFSPGSRKPRRFHDLRKR